jgi:hypothetical protein
MEMCKPILRVYGDRRAAMLIAAVYLAIGLHSVAASASDEPAVSFLHEVLPTLTKAGCNSGTCHGTPSGKNGFRLSLRGFDVESDAMTLVRESQGRRINRLDPPQSLLLRKAVADVPHQGGRRFRRESAAYLLLRDWIAQGAADDRSTAAPLDRLEATPSRATLEAPTASHPLVVTARYRDGTSRDVTHLARFSVDDESQAAVTAEGIVRRLKPGDVTVAAEYMGGFATARLLFLDAAPDFVWNDPPENNFVDTHVFARLKQLRIPPSEPCTDAEFVRRVHLDLIGRLPTAGETRRFLADASPAKRAALIDDLLDRPEFADWWALKWTDRLGCNQRFVGKIGAIKYHAWIRNAMAVNQPEDEFVKAIVTAKGGNYGSPAAGFFRRVRDPLTRAEETAQLFLGIRMQCARCHNHPGEKWTQDDYYCLAEFFARMSYKEGPFFIEVYNKEETVLSARKGEVTHPRTKQVVAPRFPGGEAPAIPDEADRRDVLAAWLTSPENPFFAQAAVNRYWYHLLGRGIVEPVDDFRGSNPASQPELLDSLAADFVRHGFDRKHLIRTIALSRTYQQSARTTPANADDVKYFSHAQVRLLPAEALLDAVSAATGVHEKFPGLPAGTPAAALPDGEYKHPFLEAFCRPARAMACECERDGDTNLSQALHLVGGSVVDQKIRSDSSRAATLAKADVPGDAAIDELFLATLSRYPTTEERALCQRRLATSQSPRRQALEDLLWMLINHREFLFRH